MPCATPSRPTVIAPPYTKANSTSMMSGTSRPLSVIEKKRSECIISRRNIVAESRKAKERLVIVHSLSVFQDGRLKRRRHHQGRECEPLLHQPRSLHGRGGRVRSVGRGHCHRSGPGV